MAFEGCTGLTSISIPAGVTEIESSTFYGCTGLTSISIPAGVTEIGYKAFYGCTGLTSITIPAGVTTISRYAFNCCNNAAVQLPDTITEVGSCAFGDKAYPTKLCQKVRIPSGNKGDAIKTLVLYSDYPEDRIERY